MNAKAAWDLCADALIFLTGDPDRLHTFLSTSGLTVEDLKLSLNDNAILAAALSHVCGNEESAREFSNAHALKPGALQNALRLIDPAAGEW
jgi:hypothetical protein